MAKKEDEVSKSDQSVPFFRLDLSFPPEFVSCGRFISPEGWVHRERVIDSWELIMGIEGTVWLEEEDRPYVLGSRDVLFFRPGLRHRGWKASCAGASFYWVHFRPRTRNVLEGLDRAAAGVELPVWLPSLSLDKARVVMAQVQDAPGSPHASPVICDYLCGSLLLEIQRSWQEHRSPAPGLTQNADTWFTRLLAWARLNLDRPLNVEDLARQAQKHPDHLARTFKRHLGMSPLAWLHRQRLEAAKKLLMETNLSIKQIAWNTGFGDARQFTKIFSDSESLSPSLWRRTYSRMYLNRE